MLNSWSRDRLSSERVQKARLQHPARVQGFVWSKHSTVTKWQQFIFPIALFTYTIMGTMVYNGYSKIWEVNKVQYGVFKKVEYEHSNFRRPLQSLLLKYTTENLQVM